MEVTTALVRSLYGDISPDEDGNYLFSDDIITGWIELTGGNPYRAAAIACFALAADQNYLLKDVSTDDLSVTGSATASEFRKLGENLNSRADEWDDQQDNSIAIVGVSDSVFSRTRYPEGAYPPFWR